MLIALDDVQRLPVYELIHKRVHMEGKGRARQKLTTVDIGTGIGLLSWK